jgi:stage III sporulation protein SpoIIIAA
MVDLLPQGVRQQLLQHPELPLLLEVVMDLGRAPLARFPSGDVRLAAVDEVVTEEQLQYAVQQVGEFGGDNRAGIDKTLVRGWRRQPLSAELSASPSGTKDLCASAIPSRAVI